MLEGTFHGRGAAESRGRGSARGSQRRPTAQAESAALGRENWGWREMRRRNCGSERGSGDWRAPPHLLFSSVVSKNQKVFKILRHIESFGTCIKR